MLSTQMSIVVDEDRGSLGMANVVVGGYSIVGKHHCKWFTNKQKLNSGHLHY